MDEKIYSRNNLRLSKVLEKFLRPLFLKEKILKNKKGEEDWLI
jgi:hypothetical protein